MSKKHKHKNKKQEAQNPRMPESNEEQSEMRQSSEGSLHGPHLKDPGESSNRSQDEGKVYDL